MSIRVSISTAVGDLDFSRPLYGYLADSPAAHYRQASEELRKIADDIDRMYPTLEKGS